MSESARVRLRVLPGTGPERTRMLRVLIVTKIFPNQRRPDWAPFNRQQFGALSRLPGVKVVDVLATVPWFPGIGWFSGRSLAADLTTLPESEIIDGLPVRHPRTLYLPKVGHALSGGLYAASLARSFLAYDGLIDVVLASWGYPDGCAAVLLGRLLRVPVVVKLHGSDINVLSRMPGPRFMLRRFLPRAARVVAVSAALSRAACELGVDAARIDVVRNGVDGALFFPRDRERVRRELGLPGEHIVVCVSRMEREKGVLDLLEAFALLRADEPGARLLMVGDGGALSACQERARQDDLRGAVIFTGAVPHARVPLYLAAADIAAMPSWAEGLPNTILEAHATGLPVCATDVGGVSEVLGEPYLGRLVQPRRPLEMARALVDLLRAERDAGKIVRAARNTWQDSARALRASLVRAADGA